MTSAIADPVLDLLVLLLPLPMVWWKLHLTRARKIALTATFICGYLALLCSTGRLVSTVIELPHAYEDLYWNDNMVIVWSAAELNSAIISINVPGCLQLGRRVYQNGFKSLFKRDSDSVLPVKISDTTNDSRMSSVPDRYGFSPLRSSFNANQMNRRSGVAQRGTTKSLPPLPGIEEHDWHLRGFPTEVAAVHIRKDVTVKEDDDIY